MEDIYESHYDEQSQIVNWEAAFQEMRIPEWQHDRLRDADQVEEGFGSRFISISSEGSHEGYRDMKAFIVTVHHRRLRELLGCAIGGRGAFRYFKDVVFDYPAERERWFKFKQARLHQRILDWLAAIGIAPL